MRFDFGTSDFIEVDRERDHLAVVAVDGTLTWGELHGAVTGLASCLGALALDPERPVVIFGHKESWFVIAILALWREGLAYLPIEASLPKERIAHILAAARPALVIEVGDHVFPVTGAAQVMRINGSSARPMPPQGAVAPRAACADPLRYVFFTSGSTGLPKGVPIRQRHLAAWCDWQDDDAPCCASDVFVNLVSLTFDVSLMDITGFARSGGVLVMFTADRAAVPQELPLLIERFGGSVIHCTPSHAAGFLFNDLMNGRLLPTVRRLTLIGEAFAPRLARALRERFPAATIVNGYGPTEATIIVSQHVIDHLVPEGVGSIPIGRVMRGTTVMIKRADGTLTDAEGVTGELVIIGPTVSDGYWGATEEKARAFTPVAGRPAYHTGDHGYYKDGLLHYVGRVDDQIKYRGHRIDLGDIDANLRQIHGVDDAVTVTVTVQGTVTSLRSFVVAESELKARANAAVLIREALSARIPEYMIPRDIMLVDSFPLSPAGKIDRPALGALRR